MPRVRLVLGPIRFMLRGVGYSPFATTTWGIALSCTFLIWDRITAGGLRSRAQLGLRTQRLRQVLAETSAFALGGECKSRTVPSIPFKVSFLVNH